MAPAVEARSLSSVTTLAANPPLYPRNPTQAIHQPLVLYIARVPGSKGDTNSPGSDFLHVETHFSRSDVFLTTLKPRERVVTVEDIQSSLYYLHVDNADDDHFLTDFDGSGRSHEIDGSQNVQSRDKENRPEVFRKPLQRGAQPVWGEYSAPRSETDPHHQSTSQAPETSMPLKRKPLSSAAKFEDDQRQATSIKAASQSPARQLLGPRPLNSRAQTSLPEQTSTEKQLPGLPDKPFWTQTAVSTNCPPTPSGTALLYPSLQRQRSNSWNASSTTDELSLTLIRRDPASGGQWNVGKILSVPLGEAAPNDGNTPAHKSTKSIRRPLDVEIRTPGYVKFRASSSQTTRASFHQNSTITDQYEPTANIGALRDGVFRRRLSFGQSVLPQQRPWQRKPGSSEPSNGSVLSLSGESSDSSLMRGRYDFDENPSASSLDLPASETKSKAQGYTFLSPWNGTCEFLTGVAGRSLICKHRLPPGVAATAPSPAVTVSDLRFNLPSSGLFKMGQPNASTPSTGRKQSRLSFISQYKHRRQHSSESVYQSLPLSETGSVRRGSSSDGSDADDSKMDLSLGQEYAGGGFGGRQAKLGKLIIEDEGLKMLDLLVAANMALWWHVYERCLPP